MALPTITVQTQGARPMSRRFRTRQNARPWANPDAFRDPDDQDDESELEDLGPWPMPPAPEPIQQPEVKQYGTAR